MFRRVIALIVGFVIGFIVVSIIQMISSKMYPPDPGMLPQDTEALQQYFTSLPLNARYIIMASHIIGGFSAAFITAWIADSNKMILAILVGIIIVIATVSYNLVSLAPSYILVLDFILTSFFVYLGGKLAP